MTKVLLDKRKRKLSIKKLAIALALLVFLVGCSNTADEPAEANTSEPTPTVSIEDYKELVKELNDQILNTTIPLGNMARWELNFLKALGKPSEDIADRAFEWLEEESDYTETGIKEANIAISSLMIEISDNTDTSPESQMIDIFNQVVSLYENYTGLYKTVTTAPSSVKAFAEDVSTYFSAIPTDSETLTELLKD